MRLNLDNIFNGKVPLVNLWVLQIDILERDTTGALGARDHVLRLIGGVYTSERAAKAAQMEWLADNSDVNVNDVTFDALHIMSDTALWEKKVNG